MANLGASFAGRIDQQGIEHSAPWCEQAIDAMIWLYVYSNHLVAVVERQLRSRLALC